MTTTENKKVYISNLKPTSGDALAGSINLDDIIDKIASGEIKPYINSKGHRLVNYFFSAKKEMDNWGNTHYLVHKPSNTDKVSSSGVSKSDDMPF